MAVKPIVLQKIAKEAKMHEEALHLFNLSDQSEQFGNQYNLNTHICFVYPLYLSFSYHVHDFIAL